MKIQRLTANAFFLLAFLSAGSAFSFSNANHSVLAEIYSSKEAIVEIEAEIRGRGVNGAVGRSVRRGAGVVLDDEGTILTNKHIVQNANIINVRLHDGSIRQVSAGVTSEIFDLAIIKIGPVSSLKPLELSDALFSVNDNVYSVGSSFWKKGSIISGSINAIAVDSSSGGNEHILIRTTINMHEGDSGAPIFDDKGHFAGMLFGRTDDGKTVALPVNIIKNFYDGYMESKKVE